MLHIECPHCKGGIIIEIKDINCGIFRHAIFKSSNEIVSPHASKENCEKLLENGYVYGCCKPFKLIKVGETYVPEVCEYI